MSRKQEWTALRSRLTEVLSQFGPNASEGGDYYIVEEDSGTYELKVKTFARFLLPPELVEEICEVLEDYSSKWSVSLVQVHNDGTDVTPVGGAKISALGGVEMIPPGEYSPEEVSELKGLYDSLEKLLGARGTSDPFGNGDYWIVDDGWVRHSHKVCIFNIGFLSPELTADVHCGGTSRVVWCGSRSRSSSQESRFHCPACVSSPTGSSRIGIAICCARSSRSRFGGDCLGFDVRKPPAISCRNVS